jgi:hypothetical protein
VASGDIFNESFEGTANGGYDETVTGSWTETNNPDQDAAIPGVSPCSGLGSSALRCNVTTSTSYSEFDLGSGSATTRYYRVYVYIDSHSIGTDENTHIIDVRDASGGVRCFTVRFGDWVGAVGFDALGTSFSSQITGCTVDTWYRIEVKHVNNSTGGNELKVFNASTGTQVGSTVTFNTDNTQARVMALGIYNNPASKATDIYYDGFGVSTTGYLGQ